MALSDDFSTNKMGVQWGFYQGTDADAARVRYEDVASFSRAFRLWTGTSPTAFRRKGKNNDVPP